MFCPVSGFLSSLSLPLATKYSTRFSDFGALVLVREYAFLAISSLEIE
jgi:hypothetical protein